MQSATPSSSLQRPWLQSIAGNVPAWIVLFFLIRLIGITNPPLEHSHNWRQVTGTMVARNFLETSPNILYPRVDNTNGGSGIIAMEFPLLNYLIYLVSLVFGYSHWYGRLINLLVSSAGTWYFYSLIRRFIDPKVALPATLLLLASLWFAFSRKIMPDTFSLSLAIISLYYGLVYLFNGGISRLLLFALFFELGVMSKIPAIMIPAFLCIPMFLRVVPLPKKILLSLAGIVALAPVIAWYYYWNPHLAATYGNWYNLGRSIPQGVGDLLSRPEAVFKRFYFDALRFSGFVIFVAGIVLILYRRERPLLAILLVSLPLMAGYMLKSGLFFTEHDYYILPFVPIMCLFGGYAISLVPNNRLRVIILAVIMIEGVANQQHDLRNPPEELYKLTLEKAADKFSNRNDLVAVNGGEDPQLLYFSHRKGWTINNAQPLDTAFMHSIAQKGCRYLLIDRKIFSSELSYPKVYEDEYFRAYRISY